MNKFIHLMMLCSLLLTGCCTIRNSPYQPVSIASDPPGANIVIDGYFRGITPGTFNLKRNSSHQILIEKEGYHSEKYLIASRLCALQLSSNLIFPVSGTLAGLAVGVNAGGYFMGPFFGFYGLISGCAVGALGMGIDICTGRAKVLSTNQVRANLKSNQPFIN